MTARLGIVVIGRNEGARLPSSLRAAIASGAPVVYADSSSTDGSLERARAEGATVVVVGDPPFTAARGRNEGLRRLGELHPEIQYVQFVDGDTTLDPGWTARAAAALDADATVAGVCGHLAERDSARSTARRLMQMEWAGPAGEIATCGGNAMYRLATFRQVGGFRASLAGGEEPDLCDRLWAAGGRILRLDAPMGVHDSGVDTFGAWWTRSARVGRAFAVLLDDPMSQHAGRASRAIRSALVWGALVPSVLVAGTVAVAFVPFAAAVPLAVLLLYAVQFARIRSASSARGLRGGDASLYAASCIVSKFAYVAGWLGHRLGGVPRPSSVAAGAAQL